jgi:hypothetical protein
MMSHRAVSGLKVPQCKVDGCDNKILNCLPITGRWKSVNVVQGDLVWQSTNVTSEGSISRNRSVYGAFMT